MFSSNYCKEIEERRHSLPLSVAAALSYVLPGSFRNNARVAAGDGSGYIIGLWLHSLEGSNLTRQASQIKDHSAEEGEAEAGEDGDSDSKMRRC